MCKVGKVGWLCGGAMLFQSVCCVVLFLWSVAAVHAEPARMWHTIAELSETERAELDLRTDTPRDPQVPYLPAEKYPFAAPYTAEEMGYRAMEFTHISRWSHAMADAFGALTSSGYLNQGVMVGLNFYLPGDAGMMGQVHTAPGEDYYRMAFYYTYPPESNGAQDLWVLKRTDQRFTTKLDYFTYSPTLRRVRRQPQPRRDTRFPNNAQSFDDVIGRDAWEFSWRLLGTDVLDKTVRFPNTRTLVTLAHPDGTFREVPTAQLKMMGDSYPFYTAEGGVACYVVEAEARAEWLPDYAISKLIYWLDRHYFYPLRIEQYNRQGKLNMIEERLAKQENPAREDRGYAALLALYYDLSLDLMSYSLHDAHLVKEWTPKDREVLFGPDFMRRGWLMYPLKTQALVNSPAEFYLRPLLYLDKFPQERKIELSPEVERRVGAQEAAGHVVFDSQVEASAP